MNLLQTNAQLSIMTICSLAEVKILYRYGND